MKRQFLLTRLLLLFALIVGSGSNAWADNYKLYSGDLTEGDYIIVYSGKAMNTTVTSDRLQYVSVTPSNNVITTTNASIVWHIAPSNTYWTIYNAEANKYAASTGAKNKAQMLASGTDDMSLWSVSGSSTYDFVNKKNTANKVNANLRNNGNYGFACYATDTGGALSLYKKTEAHNVVFSVNGENTDPISKYEDDDINFPSTPSTLGGKTFVGWTTSYINGTQVEKPTTLINKSKTKMGDSDVTYYAVYADGNITTGWQKLPVSEISEEGVYALITTDGHAFNGTITSGHGQRTTGAFSFTNNIATSAPEGTCEITLNEVTGGGFTMYNSTNKYLYATKAASGGLAWHDSEDNKWIKNSDNWQYSKNYSGSYARLRSYNNSSFRTYSADNGDALLFAKKIEIFDCSSYCTSITEPVTITSAGYATYVSDNDLDYSDVTGLKAYKAKVSGNSIAFTRVITVPAGEGVLLRATSELAESTVFNIPVTTDVDAWAESDNDFIRGTGATVKTKVESNYNYILSTKGGVVGFYNANGNTVANNRAYLSTTTAPTTNNSRLSTTFDDDETTGINAVENVEQTMKNAVIYNLNGQRVVNPIKGLYIVNGKKVIFNK